MPSHFRHPSNLLIPKGSGDAKAGQKISDDNLILIGGDVTKKSDVDSVFAKTKIDGVIIALGGTTKDVGATMLSDGTTNIVAAMKENRVMRLAVVTAIGAGDSISQAPIAFKLLKALFMKKMYNDKNHQEEIVIHSDLEYCVVRPGGLTVDPPTGVVNVIDGKAGNIARADLARFLLSAVTEEDFKYIRKTPCVSSVAGTSWFSGCATGSRS